MRYECPSCFLVWEDSQQPAEQIKHPLCSFCGSPHSQKELLNWQMNHIKDLNPKRVNEVLFHFYRFVDNELKTLRDKYNENRRTQTTN